MGKLVNLVIYQPWLSVSHSGPGSVSGLYILDGSIVLPWIEWRGMGGLRVDEQQG